MSYHMSKLSSSFKKTMIFTIFTWIYKYYLYLTHTRDMVENKVLLCKYFFMSSQRLKLSFKKIIIFTLFTESLIIICLSQINHYFKILELRLDWIVGGQNKHTAVEQIVTNLEVFKVISVLRKVDRDLLTVIVLY